MAALIAVPAREEAAGIAGGGGGAMLGARGAGAAGARGTEFGAGVFRVDGPLFAGCAAWRVAGCADAACADAV